MFNKFRDWLKEKRYSEITLKGNLSTCSDYARRIEYIIWYENLSSWQDVVNNIDILLPAYSKGGIREKIGQKSHASVINALKSFCKFIIENNIKPQKTKKLVLHNKPSDGDEADDDTLEMTFSIYTIKYLDDGYIIRVTADKNKMNNNVFYYDIEKSPLMQNLLRKKVGDIVSFKAEDGNFVKVEIIDKFD